MELSGSRRVGGIDDRTWLTDKRLCPNLKNPHYAWISAFYNRSPLIVNHLGTGLELAEALPVLSYGSLQR